MTDAADNMPQKVWVFSETGDYPIRYWDHQDWPSCDRPRSEYIRADKCYSVEEVQPLIDALKKAREAISPLYCNHSAIYQIDESLANFKDKK